MNEQEKLDDAIVRVNSLRTSFTGTTWRHLKRGTIYEIVDFAINSDDLGVTVIYKSVTDGMSWTRPSLEFFDGRFEHVVEALNGDTV